jgi:hypothetical protein
MNGSRLINCSGFTSYEFLSYRINDGVSLFDSSLFILLNLGLVLSYFIVDNVFDIFRGISRIFNNVSGEIKGGLLDLILEISEVFLGLISSIGYDFS